MPLNIEEIRIDDLKNYTLNAKEHSEKQIQQIAQSIKAFGFNNPILIDEDNTIIAGHGRLAAAQTMNLAKVPCIRLTHLTPSQQRAYRIADNKIAMNGGWNEELLKLELSELEIVCEEFDITDTGFETLEIDSLFSEKPTKKLDEKANHVPFIPEDEIVTKKGDVWLLGKHRLICGSSLEDEVFIKLMDGKLADIVLADPPYNVSARSIGSTGKTKHKDFAMAAGEMSKEEFTKFLAINMSLCSKYSAPNALGYFWMDWRHMEEMMEAGHQAYPELINLCVWVKRTGGMGKLYRSRHELCFVFGKNRQYLDNVELGKHGRYRTNCWEYDGVNSFGAHKEDLKFHSTVKPYEMFKDIILDASPRGGIVLDGFMGSGTTIIAAEKAKRICYGIEYEPVFVDTALRRFQELFKIDAIHAESGKTYNELLAEIKNDRK
jgi:DNA modification methylase